jgi:hypothetical protein
LDRPLQQWQQLFATVLDDHSVVGVRDTPDPPVVRRQVGFWGR